LPWFNNIVGIQFTALFFILSLALLISVGTKQGLEFQPPSFAFGAWINETGWPSGVVWFTGLVQAAYGLTAFDSVCTLIFNDRDTC
jgi:choline transport protein